MALKIGVVGLNRIGNLHLKCYKENPLAEVVAVCDLVEERANAVASEHGVKAYTSVTAMLDAHPDMDIVDVSTGGHENGSWHFEPVMEALERRKHVLVEKPLSNDLEEARIMVAKAEEVGVYFGCNLNHYFTPPAEKAKELIYTGELGELRYCVMKMGFSGGEALYGGPAKDARYKDYPYFHVKAFLAHPFSVMRYLCGDVSHIQAFFSRPAFRQTAGDNILSHTSIHMQFVNDCTGYLLSHRGDTPSGLGGWWNIEVGGTKGTISIENCIEKLTVWSVQKVGLGEEPKSEVEDTGIKDFNETFPRRINAFLEDVSNRVAPENLRSSGRDALATLEYTFAAIESHEQGGALVRPAHVPLVRGSVEG